MTKKDYILIADAIVDSILAIRGQYENPSQREDGIWHFITRIQLGLRNDNSRFSPTTFLSYIENELANNVPIKNPYRK